MATTAASRLNGPVLQIRNNRSASPSHVKLAPAGSARSQGKSFSVSSPSAAKNRRSCMCSPTNHPGSFRCNLHKERKQEAPGGQGHSKPTSPPAPFSTRAGACSLGAKRTGSALVRIGAAVDSGAWARRALAPSPHRRRAGVFRPRPSRLSAVSFAGDRAGDNRQ